MNIGIDIDNVISKFDEALEEEFLKHDKELRNTGIIDPNKHMTEGMFDWSEEELWPFYLDNVERIAKNLGVKEGAKEYIEKLKEDGHTIVIITGRDNGEYSDPYNMTKKWLREKEIPYDKLIFTKYKKEKAEKCIENGIDVMIDDSNSICRECYKKNITTLIMDKPCNREEKEITRVYNWKEIYEFITNYKKEKVNVILDTDMDTECDDHFALAYLLKPYRVEKVRETLEYYLKKYDVKKQDEKTEMLEVTIQQKKIFIRQRDIYFLESMGRVVSIYCKNGVFKVYSRLGELEEKLDSDMFLRCNQSYIVNILWVSDIVDYDFYMPGDRLVPIRKRDKKEIIQKFYNKRNETDTHMEKIH